MEGVPRGSEDLFRTVTPEGISSLMAASPLKLRLASGLPVRAIGTYFPKRHKLHGCDDLSRLIDAIKAGRAVEVTIAASLLLWHIKNSGGMPSLVVPIPSKAGWKRRNGALRLAEAMSALNPSFSFVPRSLLRNFALPKGDRDFEDHVLSLEAGSVVKGKRILLLDDVITSGTSMLAASSCLIAEGASEINAWCLGKTYSYRNSAGAP